MRLEIVTQSLGLVSPENPYLFIDGVCATLTIVAGGGVAPTALIDGLPGDDWATTAAGGPLIIHYPPVYVDGKPVLYDKRIALVGKWTGTLTVVHLRP